MSCTDYIIQRKNINYFIKKIQRKNITTDIGGKKNITQNRNIEKYNLESKHVWRCCQLRESRDMKQATFLPALVNINKLS